MAVCSTQAGAPAEVLTGLLIHKQLQNNNCLNKFFKNKKKFQSSWLLFAAQELPYFLEKPLEDSEDGVCGSSSQPLKLTNINTGFIAVGGG